MNFFNLIDIILWALNKLVYRKPTTCPMQCMELELDDLIFAFPGVAVYWETKLRTELIDHSESASIDFYLYLFTNNVVTVPGRYPICIWILIIQLYSCV